MSRNHSPLTQHRDWLVAAEREGMRDISYMAEFAKSSCAADVLALLGLEFNEAYAALSASSPRISDKIQLMPLVKPACPNAPAFGMDRDQRVRYS